MRKEKEKTEKVEHGVIWICRTCGAYNLDPLDLHDFECIACGERLYAEAHIEFTNRPKP